MFALDQGGGGVHPANGAVRMLETKFQGEVGLVVDGVAPCPEETFSILGVHVFDPLVPVSREILAASDTHPGIVDIGNNSAGVGFVDTDGKRGGEGAKSLFAGGERFVGDPPIGHVFVGADPSDDLIVMMKRGGN